MERLDRALSGFVEENSPRKDLLKSMRVSALEAASKTFDEHVSSKQGNEFFTVLGTIEYILKDEGITLFLDPDKFYDFYVKVADTARCVGGDDDEIDKEIADEIVERLFLKDPLRRTMLLAIEDALYKFRPKA